MDKLKTASLVTRAQQGDRDALQELLGECYESLYYFAYKTVKNEDLAADITQEGCIKIMTTLSSLRDPGAFSTWAHQIIYHQCTHYFRDNREVALEENEEGETILDTLPDDNQANLPEQVVQDKEFQATMQQMLDSLPPEQRSALLLYYYEKLSVKQIAQIHATTEGTVKSRLNYGRKAVKKQVEAYEKRTGVRLHSAAPLPLLLYFLFHQGAEASQTAAAAALPGVSSAVAAATAKAAGSTAAKAGGLALGKKLIALALAATAVTTTAVGTMHLRKDEPQEDRLSQTQPQPEASTATVPEDNLPTTPPVTQPTIPVHQHEYPADWEYDQEEHWQICACGKLSPAATHTYEGHRCSVCGHLTGSPGLAYTQLGTSASYCCTGIGTCQETQLAIPAEYNGEAVTGIGSQAFSFLEAITAVDIAQGITTIGDRAFWGCTGIRSITIPDSVTTIQQYAFWKCTSLTSITLPSNLYRIREYTFDECSSLKTLVLPEALGEIGEGAFYKCTALESITIPASVRSIGGLAFAKCPALTDIYFGGTMAQWQELESKYQKVMFGQDWAFIFDENSHYTVHCADGDYSGWS